MQSIVSTSEARQRPPRWLQLAMFAALLKKDPGAALKVACWRLVGKRVRAWHHLRHHLRDSPHAYFFWRQLQARAQRSAPVAVAAESTNDPLYREDLARRIRPLLGSATLHAMQKFGGTWYVIVAAQKALVHAHVVESFRRAATERATPAIFYADQDEHDARGRRINPWLKPSWDEAMFLAQDYVSTICALPLDDILRCAPLAIDDEDEAVYALIAHLALGQPQLPVQHVPTVGATVPMGSWRRPSTGRIDTVRQFARLRHAEVIGEGPYGTVRVCPVAPDREAEIAVIIPTRDRVDLLKSCIGGVLDATDYENLKIIVVDNGSVEPFSLRYFDEISVHPKVEILPMPGKYNYAALNNEAVRRSNAELLCFLNNDVEILGSDWLRRMVAHAVREDVGAVGARLLYPDSTIQHAGVVIGLGGAAGHAHRGDDLEEAGYFAQTHIARTATAVTAACLVVERAKFNRVGGFDALGLAIAYNDVDLCLKLRAINLRNIYEPAATLVHHESKSRGSDFSKENLQRYRAELATFQERWGSQTFQDPTHHPALDRASEKFTLSLANLP